MLLVSEGLPAASDHLLQRIFAEVYQKYELNAAEAAADLQTYQRFLCSDTPATATEGGCFKILQSRKCSSNDSSFHEPSGEMEASDKLHNLKFRKQ